MLLAPLLFALLSAAAAYVVACACSWPAGKAVRVALAVLAAGWICAFLLHFVRNPVRDADRPRARLSDNYVASATCRECHPGNYRTWHASYHRTMTQVVRPEAVIPEFASQEVEVAGRRYVLDRRGDEYWVEMDDPDTPPSSRRTRRVSRRLLLTTGSHHMQVFWYGAGGRRLANLPIVYLVDEARWIPRRSAFIMPTQCSQDAAGTGADAGRWNISCIECHTTHGRPRILGDGSETDSQVVEFGIACEACHGPAAEHVRANQNPLRRYQLRRSQEADSTIVNPQRLAKERSAETCGQCHSIQLANSLEQHARWNELGHEFRPGDKLGATRLVASPARRDHPTVQLIVQRDPDFLENTFWSDGMVRVAGREFNGLLETACFQRGELTCLTCHRMHPPADGSVSLPAWADDQLRPEAHGNQACLSCHASIGARLAEHTRHAPESSGSLCYNCHMPHTTYGLLKGIRSHQVDSPNVATTLATGRPNACNLCHLDHTLAWTAEHLAQWYGHPAPQLEAAERDTAASLQWLLSGDAGQRALIAWSMSWEPAVEVSGSRWMAPYLAQLLEDPYDAVRFIASRSLRELPGFDTFPYDFVAPPDQLADARQRALQRWRDVRPAGGDWPAALLFEADGELRLDEVHRLNEARDDRPISLLE